jgi:hypothetical protein
VALSHWRLFRTGTDAIQFRNNSTNEPRFDAISNGRLSAGST